MSCLRLLTTILVGWMFVALPLAVAADPEPNFDLSINSIALSVADCDAHCVISSWFAPQTTQTFATILVTNKSNLPLNLDVAFDASGAYPDAWQSAVGICIVSLDASGKPQCQDIALGVKLPVGGRSTLRVAVATPGVLKPSKYAGNLLFTATAVPVDSQPLHTTKRIPLVVNVRADAFRVLLVLLTGVIGGRLFKQVNSQDAVKLMALYDRYLHLRESPPIDPNDPLAQWWNGQLDFIKNQIDQGDPDMTAIANSLKKLEDTSTLVRAIATTRAYVSNLPSTDPRKAKVVADLQGALTAIVQGQLNQAKILYDEALQDAVALSTMSPPVQAVLQAIQPRVQASFASLTTLPPQNLMQKARRGVISLLNRISGDSSIPVEIEYSYVRPVMTLTLLVVLAIYGMWQNYSGSDDVSATFGAQGIASYAIIFLWGFSAQVLTWTLQTLPFNRSSIPVKP